MRAYWSTETELQTLLISARDGGQWPAAAALPPEKSLRFALAREVCGPQSQLERCG